MRTRGLMVVVAGLAMAGVALAQQGEPAAQPATQPATQPAANPEAAKQQAEASMQGAQDALKAAVPPAPKGRPVPDGPVVEKKELEGGLIVEDLKIGTGAEVKPGGTVVAYYHGTLKSNGERFDSAFERGEPVAFPLSGVIPGWQKGIPGMKVGGVRRLTIPAALGYGERGAGAMIPPNSDLVFVVEMVDTLGFTDVTVGTGDESVSNLSVVVTAYTIKNDKGEVVDSATKDKPFIWFPGEWSPLNQGVEGMKVGGKREIRVPAAMNKANPSLPSKRPADVALTMEVELLHFRNLPQQGR
jgi:FKBP-type peptidyl-prolyl cis-trans isomerase